MENEKTSKSEQNTSSKTEIEIEYVGKKRSHEIATAVETDQQLKDVCKKKDVHDNPNDANQIVEQKIDQHTEVLPQREKAVFHSPLKKMRTGKSRHEAVACRNPVKTRKITIFRRFVAGPKKKDMSLRRRAILAMTRKRLFTSEIERCKKEASKTEFQDLQNEPSRISDGENDEMVNGSSGSFEANSPLANDAQNQATSSNRLQKVSTYQNQPTTSNQLQEVPTGQNQPSSSNRSQEVLTGQNQPTSSNRSQEVPTGQNQPTSSNRSQEVLTGKNEISSSALAFSPVRRTEEVWSHFVWFMEMVENLNRSKTAVIHKVNSETTDNVNHSLKDPTTTESECTSQCLRNRATTTESTTTELPNDFGNETLDTWNTNSACVLKYIQNLRLYLLRETDDWEKTLDSRLENFQEEKKRNRKIKGIIEIRDIQTALHPYYTALCDQEQFFNQFIEMEKFPRSVQKRLSNSTSLIDFPMSATHMLTLSSLFLFLQKSLYSKIPIENIFQRMNSENYFSAYMRYRRKKSLSESERKMLEDIAIKFVFCFNASLEECRLKMNRKILRFEKGLLQDYQNFIHYLINSIDETLNCMNKLFLSGSLVVFPLLKYLCESRRKLFDKFVFLDKRRPDVFT